MEVVNIAHQVAWNKIFIEEFGNLAGLSEIEIKILETRMLGWTRTKQCMEYNLSMSTLDRMVKRMKVKYDKVQPYSNVLPPRRFSAEETYMDEN